MEAGAKSRGRLVFINSLITYELHRKTALVLTQIIENYHLISISTGKDCIRDEELCKICMDHPVDCVMLECGHMCTCTRCGKQMAECPICRQYVVRVVRTFKA